MMKLVIPMIAAGLVLSTSQTMAQQVHSQTNATRLTQQADPAESGTNAAQAGLSEKQQSELRVSEQQASQQVQDVNKASKLIGMSVKNTQNEDLGQIKDIVVDFKSGKVAYAVLAHGTTLGFGGKMIAVPFNALTVQTGEKALLLNLPKQQLAQAPGFNEDNWPDLNSGAAQRTIGLAPATSRSQDTAVGGSELDDRDETKGSVSSDEDTGSVNDPTMRKESETADDIEKSR